MGCCRHQERFAHTHRLDKSGATRRDTQVALKQVARKERRRGKGRETKQMASERTLPIAPPVHSLGESGRATVLQK